MIDQSQHSQIENISMQNSPDSHKVLKSAPINNTDEINVLEYIYVLVKNKWWIIGAMVIGLVTGYIAAIVKGPTYVAEVVIAPKENDNKNIPSISGLGAFGGLMASQLNLGGNPDLGKIELLVDSRKFHAEMVETYHLLPKIYKYEFSNIYLKSFDTLKQDWNSKFKKPNSLSIGDYLKSNVFKKSISKENNTMTISVTTCDSSFTDTLMTSYLQYLNFYLRSTVQNNANERIAFLENRLLAILDPLLREKIQGLIANEIEKTMLISKESYEIVDSKYMKKQFKQKKLYPLIFGFGFSFVIIFLLITKHVISTQLKNEEDILIFNKIKKSFF